jgi:hypothetical protein
VPDPGLFRRIIDAYGDLGMVARVAVVGIIAVVTTAAGLAAIILLPADHFLPRTAPDSDSWWRRHRIVRWILLGVKNAAGAVIATLGVLMLVAPGPGLVFILLGVSLLDFPGKRVLERKLVQRPSVIRFLNDLRATFGRPPFTMEPD